MGLPDVLKNSVERGNPKEDRNQARPLYPVGGLQKAKRKPVGDQITWADVGRIVSRTSENEAKTGQTGPFCQEMEAS